MKEEEDNADYFHASNLFVAGKCENDLKHMQ